MALGVGRTSVFSKLSEGFQSVGSCRDKSIRIVSATVPEQITTHPADAAFGMFSGSEWEAYKADVQQFREENRRAGL